MTVVAMSSLFSFQSPSTACKTSVGVQAFLVGSMVGRMAGTLLIGGRKHTRWKRGRLRAHKFFLSARLSKFGQGLRSVRRPYVGISTPTLEGFCDGHKDFLQLYRLLSTFSTVDHVKNAQSCVNRVNALCGTYGGTYEKRSCFSPGLLDPKSLILIWDTGTSYGLIPFRSDFIDYVKCEIPVRDVTKVNTVVGIGTTLHKCVCVCVLGLQCLGV
jgi:hypothetical protein